MVHRASRLLIAAGLILTGWAVEGHAVPTTVPTSLGPGDQYRLAFLTSATRNASPDDIATYNAFVTGVANTQAALAALGTTWAAIGSTEDIDARDNTSTNPFVDGAGVPIFLLNDTLLASGNADLWDGSLATPLVINEAGLAVPGAEILAWTGTAADGQATGFELDSFAPTVGDAMLSDSNWVDSSFRSQSENRHLYGLSGILVVVPEPGAGPLLALGLAGLLALGRRG